MARTDEELILLGKRWVIEQAYGNIECHRCGEYKDNPICKVCSEHFLRNGFCMLRSLRDEQVEKLYKEIEEYENKRYK